MVALVESGKADLGVTYDTADRYCHAGGFILLFDDEMRLGGEGEVFASFGAIRESI
ncbi:hypothetical protein ACTMU2_15435 [Cupriavidus basilensis]